MLHIINCKLKLLSLIMLKVVINIKHYFNITGIIMVDIDPIELVRGIWLRCFGEIYQERLYRYLKIFLNRPIEG